MISWRLIMIGIVGGILVLLGTIILFLQDELTEFSLRPRIPYQIYTPPPPPAYASPDDWAIWPSDPEAGLMSVQSYAL